MLYIVGIELAPYMHKNANQPRKQRPIDLGYSTEALVYWVLLALLKGNTWNSHKNG